MASNSTSAGGRPSRDPSPPNIPSQEPGWTRLEGKDASGEVLQGAETGQRFFGVPGPTPQTQSPEAPVAEDAEMGDGFAARAGIEWLGPRVTITAVSSSNLATDGMTATRAQETGTAVQETTPPVKQEQDSRPAAANNFFDQQAGALLTAVNDTANSSNARFERSNDAPATAPPANIFGMPTADRTGVTLPDGEVLRLESPPLERLGQTPSAGDRRDSNGQTIEEALRAELGPNHPHAAVLGRIEQDLQAEWFITAQNGTHVTLLHQDFTVVVTRASFDRIREHVGHGRRALATTRREMAGPAPPASRLEGSDDRAHRRRSMLETVSGPGERDEREGDAAQAVEDMDTDEEQEAEANRDAGGSRDAGGNDWADDVGDTIEVKRER